MKRIIAILLVLGLACAGLYYLDPALNARAQATQNDDVFADAFKHHRSGIQVSGKGEVIRILSDDNVGSRHQRFILKLTSGQTLLIAHNIDIAPRIDALKVGDIIFFNGVYEWNDKGGVIHWTHRDPDGIHAAGWLRKGAKTYQ